MIDPLAERKNAAEYWLMRRNLMFIGIWLAACSVASVVMHTAPSHGLKCRPGEVTLSLMALVLAVWMLRAPSPAAFLGLCAWFVAGTALTACSPSPKFGHVLPAMIVWGSIVAVVASAYFYSRYRRFACLADAKPSREMAEEISALIKRTMKGDPALQDNMAQISMRRNWIWKIGFFGEDLLMVAGFGWDLCFARRDEVRLQDRGKVLFGTERKVTVEIGHRKWRGCIDATQWKHLEEWARATAC